MITRPPPKIYEVRDILRGEGGGGAFAVGGNQFGDVAFIEAVAQPSRALRARSGAIYRAGEYHGVAKQQVSGSHGVRSKRQGAPPMNPRSLTWAFVILKCASCRPQVVVARPT